MADQIASAIVSVDSTSAKAAAKDLDSLAAAGGRSQQSIDSLSQSANRNRQSMGAAAAAVGQYAKTANELRFATRGLPAQFTDIATSLAAGQNPLTVLLQQGGQLKDMFGGIGPAAKALGGYLTGLVNPYTLAAGAVAALAIAYVQGSNESVAFNKAIIMTGNYAGTTADNLSDMSRALVDSNTTQHAAAVALAEVASAGVFTEQQIRLVTEAAISLEREGGQAVEKTIKTFAALAEDPVRAAVELNEKFHFLTVSTYEQIKALEAQGDTMGAATLAMETYAAEVQARTKEVSENLGVLESAWRNIARGAKFAWDAMLDVGREDTGREKFDALYRQLQELENPSNAFSFMHLGPEERRKRAAQIRSELQKLADENVRDAKAANDTRLRQEAAQAAISLDQEAAQYASNKEKLAKAKAEINGRYRQMELREEQIGGKDLAQRLAAIRADRDVVLAGLEKKFKEPAAKKSDAEREAERALKAQAAEYERLNTSIDRHKSILEQAADSESRLTEVQKFAAKVISDMDNGHTKLSESQQKTIRASLEELVALDKVNEARELSNRLTLINQGINEKWAASAQSRAREAQRELDALGRGGSQNELAGRQDAILDRAQRDRIELAQKYGRLNATNTQEYLDQLKRIDEAERAALENEKTYYEERKAAMLDWRTGARRALDEITDEVNDVAGQTHDGFINAFSEMNRAVDNFAQNGKFKIKDFAKAFLAELLKIELRILLSKVLTSIFGAGMGGGAGASGGGNDVGGYSASAGGWGDAAPFALGGAFAGGRELTAYALGGLPFAGRGGVRTSPTLFPMANGAGLMAEQKAEAVVPLTRMGDGELGVRMSGGGGTVFNISTNVTVNNEGGGVTTETSGEDSEEAKRLASVLTQRIKEVLVEERRQGGILWAMTQGR